MILKDDLIRETRNLTEFTRIETTLEQDLRETREIIKLIESRQKEIVRKLEEQEDK